MDVAFPRSVHKFFGIGSYLLIEYSLNLLPYVLVQRSAFIYHYMPGLMYAMLLTALAVDVLGTCSTVVLVWSSQSLAIPFQLVACASTLSFYFAFALCSFGSITHPGRTASL